MLIQGEKSETCSYAPGWTNCFSPKMRRYHLAHRHTVWSQLAECPCAWTLPLWEWFQLPAAHLHAQLFNCVWLCNPIDCSNPQGFSVHGIIQTISSSRGSSWPRDRTCVSCVGRWILYHLSTREAQSPAEWAPFLCWFCNFPPGWPFLTANSVSIFHICAVW